MEPDLDLRAELLPPPVSRERLDELCREIERIAELVLAGAESADAEISAFNATTGHTYSASDFAEYDGSQNLISFATTAARPPRAPVAGLTRDELVGIVRKLLAGDAESDHWLRLLEAHVPHPRVSDLIFHPPSGPRDPSAERIVDEALAYRPIAL
ncbi:hypothetical protein GCM10010218_38680 [Streptomyces mashuensis]|uniref:Uncharacterized protein n=1 Tax=Streptomyces mashuensis TaxID=33904 RepID=A0A919B5Y2_9ACTN|nr:hypothetical protein [Streptomyces mashuensis]GHF53453.1 hypothetical protein GCM10010218_38680 [Streptomyces mashuensis]